MWAIFLGVGVILELIAIKTEEKNLPTLSRFIWWLKDQWPQVVVTIIVIGGVWGIVHLAGGECAFGFC